MVLFRLPLMMNKKISFWKLLGCGKNGTFDVHPDWNQWAVLVVNGEGSMVNKTESSHQLQSINYKLVYGSFINRWWKFFGCEVYSIVLEPISGFGSWEGKKIFGELPKQTNNNGIIAVLTRATIRLNRLKNFWRNVDGVALQMQRAPGFITSVGIGEIPWIKQATFSVWENKEAMQTFAYKTQQHAEVIRKTKSENWYSEEMFVRFKPVAAFGSLNGSNPLNGKL